ncbi:methyltransferase domain-containing protein [Rhodobacterales bacterium LSUCC0031]|nr:methyltransferase domain-containing protein [Rhodobacterales bacterium LSUCC0031]
MAEELITNMMERHYRDTFLKHGANSRGVDWGENERNARLRQEMMLGVVRAGTESGSILDVGCGYGDLAGVISGKKVPLMYHGMDVVGEMIEEGRRRYPDCTFTQGDVLELEVDTHDYVVCNGILTQKLNASTLEMNRYAQRLIRKMYSVCRVGVAFNMMTTHVNFQRDNLYYRNPAEMLAWCMSELTPRARIDCAYDLWYEYTIYLYRPGPEGA